MILLFCFSLLMILVSLFYVAHSTDSESPYTTRPVQISTDLQTSEPALLRSSPVHPPQSAALLGKTQRHLPGVPAGSLHSRPVA